ncbi:MAG: hypothetical protein ACREFF_06055 [Candidatus Udaeobacter sp.]
MNVKYHFLLSVALVFLNTAIASTEDLYYGGYDGTWEGKLQGYRIDLATFEQHSGGTMHVRLQIAGTQVRVFTKSGEDWSETKGKKFRMTIHKTNAVFYAIDSSSDVYDKTGSGGWVETWNFTATHKSVDTLYIAWIRSVNNYLRPPWQEKPGVPFMLSAFGEMSLVQ